MIFTITELLFLQVRNRKNQNLIRLILTILILIIPILSYLGEGIMLADTDDNADSDDDFYDGVIVQNALNWMEKD